MSELKDQGTSISAGSFFSSASQYFRKKNSQGRNSDEESQPLDVESSQSTASGSSFTESLKFWKKGPSLMENLSNKVQDMQVRAEDYKYGLLTLGFGFVVIFLSFLYLPFIAIAPQKFCALFSIGSIMCMASLGLMLGFKAFFKKLFSKQMFLYSVGYTLGLLLGLYYSTVNKQYLLSIACVIVQVRINFIFRTFP